jgi:4-amino-4-deoxy-L-arabinose transferase-like glycosyltransferase
MAAAIRIALAAALLSALPAYFLAVIAWPEIVNAGYLMAHGWRLYDSVFMEKTPGQLVLVAALGKVMSFDAAMIRTAIALPLAACGALVALGLGRRRGWKGSDVAALAVALLLLMVMTVLCEGPALWQEPLAAPFVAAAVLGLEAFERRGDDRFLILSGLALGSAVLVKQTAAWALVGALAWLVLTSRRRSRRSAVALALAGAVPYLAFAVGWGLAFGTTAHIRWTLTIPLFSSYARETLSLPSWGDLLEPLILFLPVAALFLIRRLPPAAPLASPLPWIAGALAMMALPRWGMLHFGAVPVLAALAAGRSLQLLRPVLLRSGRRQWSPRPMLLLGTAGGLLAAHAIVLLAGVGPLALDRVGGPAHGWDDKATRNEVRVVQERVRPGERFFNFLAARECIYALTGTFPSTGPHVSVGISWVLNKDGVDRRLVEGLSRARGSLVLFHEPDAAREKIRGSALYRFLAEHTEDAGRAGSIGSWRRIGSGELPSPTQGPPPADP